MRRSHLMTVMTPLLLGVTACTDDSNPAGLARPVRTPGGALALVGPSALGAPVAIGVESVAASLLRRAGHTDVSDLLGGYGAWAALTHPVG